MSNNKFCDSCDSCNSCESCKGLRMSEKMIFCLGDEKYESEGDGFQKNTRIFNRDVSENEYEETLKLLRENKININLAHWVKKEDMTDEDKKNYPSYKELGGCLKTFSYEEVWSNFWNEATQKQKDTITGLKWFNAGIFKEITGIDVEAKVKEMTLAEISEKLGYEVKVIK